MLCSAASLPLLDNRLSDGDSKCIAWIAIGFEHTIKAPEIRGWMTGAFFCPKMGEQLFIAGT